MKDLFDVPEQLSPRLKWLREHDITTEATGHSPGDESPETGADLHPWVARAPGIVCGGATEHDAIVELALRKGWRLWNES